jgi:hypothetical protein
MDTAMYRYRYSTIVSQFLRVDSEDQLGRYHTVTV